MTYLKAVEAADSTVKNQSDTSGGFHETSATDRVERLRAWHLGLEPSVSIDRMRIETRVMRETEGDHMISRRAKVLCALTEEMPINIYPDEFIVGHMGIRPLCVDMNADDTRMLDAGKSITWPIADILPYGMESFDAQTQQELKEEIIPYWKGEGDWDRTRGGYLFNRYTDPIKELLFVDPSDPTSDPSLIAAGMWTSGHVGHNSNDYRKVVKKGFVGIRKEAQEQLSRLDVGNPEEQDKIVFLRAVISAMDAAVKVGKRYSEKALELAGKEKNPKRAEELRELARICERVPAHPVETFHEALQTLFFTQMIQLWEAPFSISQGPGRIDQFINVYLEKDLTEGRLTLEQAQELLDVYFIKINHLSRGFHTAVGGVKADGSDGTNLLSYMLLEAAAHTRLSEPFVSVLLHSKAPEDLLIKACRLCSLGTGHPIFLNQDVLVTMMLARGSMGGPPITLKDARMATPVGCYEPVVPGKDSGYFTAGFLNIAAAMEMVMTNGWSHIYAKQVGPKTGDPRKFTSFEEFRQAFKTQLDFYIKSLIDVERFMEDGLVALEPTPYESALIEGCIEKGVSRESGGAHYNFGPLVVGAGAIDAGDSLAVIKKLVFDEKKVTIDQLCDALEKDFEGYEVLRRMLDNAPKFGNDDDEADVQSAWVTHQYAEIVKSHKNPRGGHAIPLGAPLQYYVAGGMAVGALPSGRSAGEALSDAWSPCPGKDVNGPTSVLKSMGKVDIVEVSAGATLNLKFSPDDFKTDADIQRMMGFVQVFLDQKLFQMQINVVSADTLKDAQVTPDKHKDLVVKVAGYSTYFTRLVSPLQDGIIARTEHKN